MHLPSTWPCCSSSKSTMDYESRRRNASSDNADRLLALRSEVKAITKAPCNDRSLWINQGEACTCQCIRGDTQDLRQEVSVLCVHKYLRWSQFLLKKATVHTLGSPHSWLELSRAHTPHAASAYIWEVKEQHWCVVDGLYLRMLGQLCAWAESTWPACSGQGR